MAMHMHKLCLYHILHTVRLRTIKLSQLIHLEGEGVSDSIVGQWPHFGIAIYSIRVRYCHKVRVSHSLCKHLDIYIYIMHPSGINNVKLKDLLHIIKKPKCNIIRKGFLQTKQYIFIKCTIFFRQNQDRKRICTRDVSIFMPVYVHLPVMKNCRRSSNITSTWMQTVRS